MAEVLFVDDEPQLLLPFEVLLRARNHVVRFIKRGEDALEYLDSHPGKVNVVVLDVLMGYCKIEEETKRPLQARSLLDDGWTGVHVYHRIRQDHPEQKVVFRTVRPKADTAPALNEGAAGRTCPLAGTWRQGQDKRGSPWTSSGAFVPRPRRVRSTPATCRTA